MKFYVFNHQNPCDSFFSKPREIAVYLWGKRLSNYSILLCSAHGQPVHIIDEENMYSNVTELENYLNQFDKGIDQ